MAVDFHEVSLQRHRVVARQACRKALMSLARRRLLVGWARHSRQRCGGSKLGRALVQYFVQYWAQYLAQYLARQLSSSCRFRPEEAPISRRGY